MDTASHFHTEQLPRNESFNFSCSNCSQKIFYPFFLRVAKSVVTSKVFHQEAPNPTFPSRARPQHFFPATGRSAGDLPLLLLGSVGELSVKGNLDALYLVTQFDGGAELQVHTLLDGGQSEQQQGLAVDVLQGGRRKEILKWRKRRVLKLILCSLNWSTPHCAEMNIRAVEVQVISPNSLAHI